MKKLWQKKYKLNKDVEKFTVGNDFILDQPLIYYDCIASIAHAKMLGKIDILTGKEVKKITDELNRIIKLDKAGKFKILPNQEDCHTAIENHLTKKLGLLGKKIHTARSRNDQVLTALRLYYKKELVDCYQLIQKLAKTLKKFAQEYGQIKLPGYTHTRKAMPSSVKLWTESFIESMLDNLKLIKTAIDLINQSPLGTGAGYGLPIKNDRYLTSRLLGFKKIQQNPIYVQNSRGKFEMTILHALNQSMFDLNKIATDLIIFSLPDFGYFELPQEFCTGSSIMPQKKNPDVLELLRARYNLIAGLEQQIRNISSNLISGYHRDMQLTKEPTMKGLQITKESLFITNLIFKRLKVNSKNCAKAMTKELNAAAEVHELVLKGIPFRKAYGIISKQY